MEKVKEGPHHKSFHVTEGHRHNIKSNIFFFIRPFISLCIYLAVDWFITLHQLMYLVTCSIDFLLASIQVKIYKVIKGESVLYLCRAINSTKVHGSERSCG